MSLALLTLGMLCPCPASAQTAIGSPGDEDPGHYWRITYKTEGSISYAVLDIPYDGISSPVSGGYYKGGGPVSQNNINGSISGTITTTLTWIPAAGETLESDPPSEPVYLKELSIAEESPSNWGGSGYAPTSSGSADDGLQDPAVPFSLGYSSSGMHLIKRDGSKGLITLDPVTLTAIGPVSHWQLRSEYPGGYHWDWTGEYCESFFNVSIDADPNPRSVMITSSIDPTYHKDPVTGKQPNTPDSYGSMYADSVNTLVTHGPSINYTGDPLGSWANNSYYHWYSAARGGSDDGTFTSPGDLHDFLVGYPSFISTQEHINLKCVDASDGGIATANYYVNWHDEWEPKSWPPDGAPYKVMGPDAEMPSWPTYPWKMVTPVSGLNYPNPSFLVGYQEAGIESVDGGLELGIDPVKVHFGVSGSPTDKMPVSQTLTPSPPLGLGQETWAVYREIVNRTKGHLDHYNEHGYSGPGIWRHDVMVGIDLNYYSPYPTTNTAPSDPPGGWNPPGYN